MTDAPHMGLKSDRCIVLYSLDCDWNEISGVFAFVLHTPVYRVIQDNNIQSQ